MNNNFKVRAVIIVFMLFIVGAGCRDAPKFAPIERILADNGIPLSVTSNLIVYNDNSCDLCVKNLAYYIEHLPTKEFRLLYTTKSSKVTYENSNVKDIVSKDQFHLVQNLALFEELAKATNDYKGIYLMSVKGNHISKVEPLQN